MTMRKYGTGTDQKVTGIEPPPAEEDIVTQAALRRTNPDLWTPQDEDDLKAETER